MASKSKQTDEQNQSKSAQPEHTEATSSKAIAADAQSEPDFNQQIDALLDTLGGNLSEIDAEGGLALIDEWYSFLHKSKEPAVKELASGLKELQKLVKSGKADGHQISEVLIHLGEQTSEFATDAEQGQKQIVQRLGKQLRKSGTSIAKAEDQENLEQLDAIVEAAETEQLTSLGTDQAIGMIDQWYALLNKSEDTKFQAVASSLKELKQALKRSNPKPETIATVLSQLGEQTVEVASDAPRGFKGVVQKLGKQLSRAATSLESAESAK